jgi:hypothetical protein
VRRPATEGIKNKKGMVGVGGGGGGVMKNTRKGSGIIRRGYKRGFWMIRI